jgi:hypothetical protein
MRTSRFRERPSPTMRIGMRSGGKIRWLLRTAEEVIYNRLDRLTCDLPSTSRRRKGATLGYRFSAFIYSSFKLVRYCWAAQAHESVTFRRSEAT